MDLVPIRKAVNNLGVALLSQGKVKDVRIYPLYSVPSTHFVLLGHPGPRGGSAQEPI